MLPVIPISSLSALAGELVKNICWMENVKPKQIMPYLLNETFLVKSVSDNPMIA